MVGCLVGWLVVVLTVELTVEVAVIAEAGQKRGEDWLLCLLAVRVARVVCTQSPTALPSNKRQRTVASTRQQHAATTRGNNTRQQDAATTRGNKTRQQERESCVCQGQGKLFSS